MAFPRHFWLRVKFWLLSPVMRLVLRMIPPQSPWERMSMPVPRKYFGIGSLHEFAHYFSGVSSVPVSGMDDVINWLLNAEYRSDQELFNEVDYWQHPLTFEQLRSGDCEDFALWVWRKLTEAGIEAEFFVGRRVTTRSEVRYHFHAWVVCWLDGREFLFEPIARRREAMLRPLADVWQQYFPYYSVARDFRTSVFGGYLLDWHCLPTMPDVRGFVK
jgi:hypothetical protein